MNITNAIIMTNLFARITTTNELPPVGYNKEHTCVAIAPNYDGRLFVGTNEFQIVRTTNVVTNIVVTIERKTK